MRLDRVRIQNYKCLQDVAVDFSSPASKDDCFSTQFLVGLNGSGKSCFLEALGLIFTQVMQGEVPGFPFELVYRVKRDQTEVRVAPASSRSRGWEKLDVFITEGDQTEILHHIPKECQPRRIVACSSGVNHLMDSVLLTSPRASLVNSLYDLSLQRDEESQAEMAWLLEQYQALDTDSNIFSIDEKNAKLVVPVLFAIVPGFQNQEDALDYFRLRERLTERIDRRLAPIAFSLIVDEGRLRDFVEKRANSPQYGLLAKLLRPVPQEQGGPLYSWMARRSMLSELEEGDEEWEAKAAEQMIQTAVFRYEPWSEGEPEGQLWNRRLSEEFDGDPMLLLNVLATAWQSGILRDIQFAFHRGKQKTMLGMETLSDGELMWLARMGLVLMSRLPRSAETLFLFDEPDVHFNSEWNMDFVHTLRQCSSLSQDGLDHEFVITTHSTLLLTDAHAEQIHLLSAEKEGVRAEKPSISPFAAQQDELSRRLFSAQPVGSYAMQRVQMALEKAETPEKLYELIQETGPGYQRFRLYEKYLQLKKRRE